MTCCSVSIHFPLTSGLFSASSLLFIIPSCYLKVSPEGEGFNPIPLKIKEGKLQNIYSLTLGYTLKIVKGDPFFEDDYIGHRMDTRFVLVPEWEILGFDQKNAADAKSVGLAAPTKDMILEPEVYSRYGLGYDVRLNASTGKFILDFESMEYDLEQ